MICLSCGDCCQKMSPLSEGPCPYLIEHPNRVILCSVYGRRPQACKDHKYPQKWCPVGIAVLGITDSSSLAAREHYLWDLTREA